jgi:hypothetical protein
VINPMETSESHQFPNVRSSYWRDIVIACQSGVSAGLCLGFPAGIIFWLILINNATSSDITTKLMTLFVDHVEPSEIFMLLGTVSWGILLGRIVNYRHPFSLALAITAGVFIGQLPMQNGKLDMLLQRFEFPVHIHFGLVLCGTVMSVMICTGLLLGLVLRKWKASLLLAGSSGLTAVLATLIVFTFMDRYGVRVGSGNFAMPRVTAVGIMTAAIFGGATLGVVFGKYVSREYILRMQDVVDFNKAR